MIRALALCLALTGCAAWNTPQNAALSGAAANPPLIAVEGTEDSFIGLAFSGGGMRASAFAYGMTEALRAAPTGTPNGLMDRVRLVSGVSGGSVTAAQLGLAGPAGLRGFRERFLVTDAEKYMANSPFNPVTILRGLSGGANGSRTFARYLDEVLFNGATFGDLSRSGIVTWINATDAANSTPFLFSAETFDALCSDLAGYPLSQAVAASAAFPLVFSPVVLEAHKGACTYREPDWLTAARYNPEATEAMRAHARALESYADGGQVKFVKLLDGGITDNFGTTGLAIARARSQTAHAPMTPAQAVRAKRMLILVADAGVEKDRRWTAGIPGPGGVALARSIAASSISSATRSGYDAMRGEMRRWQEELVEWRCGLSRGEAARLGAGPGWQCDEVKIFVGLVNSDALDADMRSALNAVPTRLRLPVADVDLAIEAGRLATLASPAYNGFLQGLDGQGIERRIAAGIARGGRRIAPVSQ